MKRENFVSMIMGTIGVILFGVGMCMCMLPQWNAFRQGIVVGGMGGVVLLAMVVVRRKMQHKPAIVINGKSIATVILGAVGALTLGVGMCMTMVWVNLLIPGIIVGCLGIALLISLIPLCRGLQ